MVRWRQLMVAVLPAGVQLLAAVDLAFALHLPDTGLYISR